MGVEFKEEILSSECKLLFIKTYKKYFDLVNFGKNI